MAEYIGALDQGTTSTRFIVFDRSGSVISSAQKEVLAIFATSRTFALAMGMGVSQIYRKAINGGAKIRLLIPDGEGVAGTARASLSQGGHGRGAGRRNGA